MLKYSTYVSIYDKAPEVRTAKHRSVSGSGTASFDMRSITKSLSKLFRQMGLIKFMMIIMLVVSGFTVVGNVFASTVGQMKLQEKRVVVESGDTLWSIALKNKPSDMRTVVYIEGIKQHSGLKTSSIQAGDILSLPIY